MKQNSLRFKKNEYMSEYIKCILGNKEMFNFQFGIMYIKCA